MVTTQLHSRYLSVTGALTDSLVADLVFSSGGLVGGLLEPKSVSWISQQVCRWIFLGLPVTGLLVGSSVSG
jgi:hypothetical protein